MFVEMLSKKSFFYILMFINIIIAARDESTASDSEPLSSDVKFIIFYFTIVVALLVSAIIIFYMNIQNEKKLEILKDKRFEEYAEILTMDKDKHTIESSLPCINYKKGKYFETEPIIHLLLSMPEFLEILRQNKMLCKEAFLSSLIYDFSKGYYECKESTFTFDKLVETLESLYSIDSKDICISILHNYFNLIIDRLASETRTCNQKLNKMKFEGKIVLHYNDPNERDVDLENALKLRDCDVLKYVQSYKIDLAPKYDMDSIQKTVNRLTKKGIHSLNFFSKKEKINKDFICFFYDRDKVFQDSSLDITQNFTLPPPVMVIDGIKYSFCLAVIYIRPYFNVIKRKPLYSTYRIYKGRFFSCGNSSSYKTNDLKIALSCIGNGGVYYLFRKIK